MSYQKRLDQAFENVPVLPLDDKHKYVVFSDCHRGSGNNNDNFIKMSICIWRLCGTITGCSTRMWNWGMATNCGKTARWSRFWKCTTGHLSRSCVILPG